jgi:lysyl-tRNA synthetase class 2
MILSEQEQIRRDALAELRKLGINPYPAAEYKTNVFASEILENYDQCGINGFIRQDPDLCQEG